MATDTDFDRDFGGVLRPFMGGIVHGLIEAGGEDVTGTDLPRFVAAVVWITVERVNRKYSINIKPWQHGKWVLNLSAALLKELDPPDLLKQTWARAVGTALDVAWSGAVDGVRLRANDHLHAWSVKMSFEDRKKLITEGAYAKASAFVDKYLPTPDAKTVTTLDGEKVVEVNGSVFGTHLDYDIFLREQEESTVDKTRERGAELRGLWDQFPVDLPKHADVVVRASCRGFIKPDDITRALLAARTGAPVEDPEDPTQTISCQAYALKVLAGTAKSRLDAVVLVLLVAPKAEEPKPTAKEYVPGLDVVYGRRLAEREYGERQGWFVMAVRPYVMLLAPYTRGMSSFFAPIVAFVTWPFRTLWRYIQTRREARRWRRPGPRRPRSRCLHLVVEPPEHQNNHNLPTQDHRPSH